MTIGASALQLRYVSEADEPTTLPRILQGRAELSPDAPFVTVDDTAKTFGETFLHARQAAAALTYLGVRAGDKVALMLPNCVEFLDLWFGTALLGAVLVPINTGLKGEGLRYIVEHSDCKVLVVDQALVQECERSLPKDLAGSLLRFVRGQAEGWESTDQWLAGAYREVEIATPAPGDVASLLYTSGTTGRSKGVVNCHNAFAVAGHEFCRNYVRASADDVLYTSLPLFHVNAQMLSTVGALLAGLPLVLASRFSASGFLEDLRRHDATVFNYIGAMLKMIYNQPERGDDQRNPARIAVGGAAPAEIWKSFEQRFGLSILEIYGLTETATFCIGSPPEDIRVGKLGRPTKWAQVRIEREDGTEAPNGTAGEIAIRSTREDVLFKGYYKNDQATADAMSGGWFHSGDRGRRDPDGYFVFLDRLKDVIRRRGENISSYEVERIVSSHPEVAESAAVGVPSDLGEEEVMIVVVRKPGAELSPEEMVSYCRTRMASFMVPRYVRFETELPKTATERVQKFILRASALEDHGWDREANL